MKLTFKQFLEDVEISDDAFSKDQSDDLVKGNSQAGDRLQKIKWKTLPLKKAFPIEGFTIAYDKPSTSRWSGDDYDIALIDDASGEIAVHINCTSRDYQVPGATIKGIETEHLSSSKEYRGKGLVVALYKCLAENGQNLFSATLQTSGGASVWKRLIENVDATVFAVIPSDVLRTVSTKVPDFVLPPAVDRDDFIHDNDFVLVHGSAEKLNKVVYAEEARDAFWFITTEPEILMKQVVKV